MIGLHCNLHILTDLVVVMAREDRFELATGGQLQAVERGCPKETLAHDVRHERAARCMHDIIRAQQYIHRAARRHDVGAVTAQLTHFGIDRLVAAHLPTDEVPLADETRHEWRLRFVVKVVGRVPLFQATFLEDADLVADGKGFFLVMGDQNGAGTAAFENVANLMAQA